MTRYEVWIAGDDITMFDTRKEAVAYIKRRGYTEYAGSYSCEHPTEERDYYVREGEDADEDYADGYCPCITPIEDSDGPEW